MATNTTTQLKPEEDVAGPFLPDDAVLIRDLNFSYGDRQVNAGGEALARLVESARAWWVGTDLFFSPPLRTRFSPNHRS